jgi:hypothetical protein
MAGNGKKRPVNAQLGKGGKIPPFQEYRVISKARTFAIAPMMDWTDSKRATLQIKWFS